MRAARLLLALALASLAARPLAATAQPPAAVAGVAREAAAIDAARSRLSKRERILTGISAEGASVAAYLDGERYRKIVVEALGESGRTLSSFYFDRSKVLIRARVRKFGYKFYPGSGLEHVTGERLLADDVYDFVDGRLARWTSFRRANSPRLPRYAERQAEILADATSYLDFMGTPAAPGTSDGGEWSCVQGPDDRCASYRQEP